MICYQVDRSQVDCKDFHPMEGGIRWDRIIPCSINRLGMMMVIVTTPPALLVLVCQELVGWRCDQGNYHMSGCLPLSLSHNITALLIICSAYSKLNRFDPYGPPGGPTEPGRGGGRFPGRGSRLGRGRGRGSMPPGGFGDPNPNHLPPPGDYYS